MTDKQAVQATTETPGKAKWREWEAKLAEIEALDAKRRALVDEARALHAETVRLGKQEGWHV